MPDMMVANRGVFVFLCMRDRERKSKPSSAIAYITRGIGNMEPNKLRININTYDENNEHTQAYHDMIMMSITDNNSL